MQTSTALAPGHPLGAHVAPENTGDGAGRCPVTGGKKTSRRREKGDGGAEGVPIPHRGRALEESEAA